MQGPVLSLAFAFAALLCGLGVYLDKNLVDFYIFQPEQLHSIAQSAIAQHGNNTRAIVADITANLQDSHAKRFLNTHEEWVFNNAGGAMGAMYILHASTSSLGCLHCLPELLLISHLGITEYLIIFGTAIGTEGHSGRHTADDYFYVLTGTQLAYVPGEFEPEVYPPGSMHHLSRGEVQQYKMETSCFALEYARGWIPPMLGFGYADTFSSTLDFPTLWATTRITGREMIGNLLKNKL